MEELKRAFETSKEIAFRPSAFFETASREEKTAGAILREYLLYAAAIPPLSGFIGNAIVGYHGYSAPIGSTFLWAVFFYLFILFYVWGVAKAIEYVSPNFDTPPNFNGAFNLVAYSSTPALAAGIFQIIPALAPFSIVGLYSVYLTYTYLPTILSPPSERAKSFALAAVGIVVVTALFLSILLRILVGTPG